MRRNTPEPSARGASTPPRPATPPPEGELPEPLTIFLTADQRAEALRRLKRFHSRRDVALRRALGMGIGKETA